MQNAADKDIVIITASPAIDGGDLRGGFTIWNYNVKKLCRLREHSQNGMTYARLMQILMDFPAINCRQSRR